MRQTVKDSPKLQVKIENLANFDNETKLKKIIEKCIKYFKFM